MWGVPYLFIKVAVDGGLPPIFLSFVRVALAAAILLPLALHRGALRGLRTKLKPLTLFAFTEIVLPFPLIAYGEQHVSSSLAAIIIAALPLTIAILAIWVDAEERVYGARLAGLFVGLGGVMLLFGVDVSGSTDELVGALAILLATVGYAIGPLVIKRHLSTGDPTGPVAVSFLLAAIMLAPAAAVNVPSATPDGDALVALVVLGIVCSALAFILWFTLIAEIGPSRASVITYVNPAVAVALGVTILDESLTATAVAGMLLILAGSWLSTGGKPPNALARVFGAQGRLRGWRRPGSTTSSTDVGTRPIAALTRG